MTQFANFIYEYQRYSGYQPGDVNLGDYVQSIAARGFYPHVDLLLDRDGYTSTNIGTPKTPAAPPPTEGAQNLIKLIANGWYYLSDEHHLFLQDLDPLFVAFHINNKAHPEEHTKVLDLLREAAKKRPIGCRDISTQEYLEKHGIPCYFSSCLTTTIDRSLFASDEKRSGLIFSDLTIECTDKFFPIKRWLTRRIKRAFAKQFTMNDVFKRELRHYASNTRTVTHICSLEKTHAERFALAEELLRTYAKAELVITSRIHCALPCLALGTPVVLIAPYDELRYRGLGELLNHIYLEDGHIKECRIERNAAGRIVNPDRFKVHAEKLKETCQAYVNGK